MGLFEDKYGQGNGTFGSLCRLQWRGGGCQSIVRRDVGGGGPNSWTRRDAERLGWVFVLLQGCGERLGGWVGVWGVAVPLAQRGRRQNVGLYF